MCMDLELHQWMTAGDPVSVCMCVWVGGCCAQCECAYLSAIQNCPYIEIR